MQTHIRHLNRHQCKGFSLVEAAIVLGVVGLVIGGIWVAVNAVRENHKINETVTGMLNAATTLKQLITPANASPDPNGWTDLNDLCVKTEAFKGFPITSNYKIQNPFGAVAGALYGLYAGSGSRCAMYGTNLINLNVIVPTAGICQRILSKITSYYKDNSDLTQIWIMGDNNSYAIKTTFPLSPTGTDCAGFVTPIRIHLFYNVVIR